MAHSARYTPSAFARLASAITRVAARLLETIFARCRSFVRISNSPHTGSHVKQLILSGILAASLFGLVTRAQAQSLPTSAGTVHVLMTQPLGDQPGTDVTVLTVDYPPSGSTPPHEPSRAYLRVRSRRRRNLTTRRSAAGDLHDRPDVVRGAAPASHGFKECQCDCAGETAGFHARLKKMLFAQSIL